MTDLNYCSSNIGAETQVSTAAPTEGEVEPEKAGPSRISVNCPSINEIKDKTADLIHAIGARDLFRTDYDKQDGNRTLNPGQGSDKNYAAFIASRLKPVQEPEYDDDRVSIRAPSESDENFTSASETCGYYAERSSATLTCDDYTERAKADLLSSVGKESSKRKGSSQTSKSRKRMRESDTGHQGSTSSKTKRSRVSPDQGHKSDDENFEGEEEILVDIDNNRPNGRKQRPPLLPNLAARINRYWKIEAESHSTVKHLKGLYSTPENCRELVVPKINWELYTNLHPYYIRQDRKYIELQETSMAVTTAVSSIANLALEADKNNQMVDTKQIVTHALNATTLLGCAHQKLNNRRKESIAPALPKEIREVCRSL